MRRTVAGPAAAHYPIVLMGLLLAVASSAVRAHNPHDPVLALGVSPDYANDKTLYLSTFAEWNWGYKDIVRSTDGGATWTKLPKGLDNRSPISAIRVSPSFTLDGTVYAATRGDGVYASADRGNSWQLINTGLTGKSITELKIAGSPYGGHTLFAAPTTGGLYRRASTQSKWTQVLSRSIIVTVITPSPDFSTDLTVLAADAAGNLYISTDGGISWVDRGNPAAAVIYDMAIAPGGAKVIFLGTSRPGIFYSANSGNSFSNKVANLPAEAVNNVAVSPNYNVDHTVFCTTPTHSVYKSTNAGTSWTLMPSGAVITGQTTLLTEFSELQTSSTYASDGTVFLSAFDGLFVSSNAGATWAQRQTRVGLVTGLAFSPNFAVDRRVMAANYANGGLYSSADRGTTWTRVWDGWFHPGNSLSSFAIEFVRNHTGPPKAVATKNFSQDGSTSDFGTTWRVLPIPDLPDSSQALFPVYPNVMSVSPQFDKDREIFLGTRRQGVLHSRDGGTSWVASRDVPGAQEIMATAISPDYGHDHTAIVVTGDGQVWRTTNGGNGWSHVGATTIKTLSGQRVPSIAFSPNVAADHLVLVGTNNGTYFSTDEGANWKIVSNATVGASAIIQQAEFSPGFATDHQLFVNVRAHGLYRVAMSAAGAVTSTLNVGQTLLDQNVQFTVFHLSPSFSQDATILGASGRNVYRSTNGGTTWTLVGSPHS
jgi:photosystem II stability/assembly factor-like uncharacterized protein